MNGRTPESDYIRISWKPVSTDCQVHDYMYRSCKSNLLLAAVIHILPSSRAITKLDSRIVQAYDVIRDCVGEEIGHQRYP